MQQQYWFNTKTKKVETGAQSLAIYRLGPFKTYEEASKAEELLAQRARDIREEDEQEWKN